MSKECMRKFGVEEVTDDDDFNKFICGDCGAPYGWHMGLTCPTEKEIAARRPVECGVGPLDDWIDEACPTLEIKLITHAREFGIEEKLIKGFVRCCMTDIRQDFGFEGAQEVLFALERRGIITRPKP